MFNVVVTWAEFKVFIIKEKVDCTYIISNNTYYIAASKKDITASCSILITNPASADQLDFETNFKV